jgi:hypothetical protein
MIDSRAIARHYLARGWQPIPLPPRSKRITTPGWQHIRFGADEVDRHFPRGEENIGVLQGEPSGWVSDVDLDSSEARALADVFLPATPTEFGRESAPRSHRLFRSHRLETEQFKDPMLPSDDARKMLLEVRGTGTQTLFPGSVHPSGERVRWDRDEGEPPTLGRSELLLAARRLAAAALLARHCAPRGARHDSMLCLAGGLLRAGWPVDRVESFVEAVATAAGHEDVDDRKAGVRSTAKRLAARDKKVSGWPELARTIGSDVLDRVLEWLDLGRPSSDANERVSDSGDKHDGRRFRGLSHAEAMAREVPPTRLLVEDIIEAGTPGTIAGLPETFKSFIAMNAAYGVAGAGALVLGRYRVVREGPVAYWWQDDSEANELGRLQAYARRHSLRTDLPLRWHLNEGLRLPDDVEALRAEIEEHQQVLVVLDSVYNFVTGDLKEQDVAEVFMTVKAEVCDATGCTVAFVDHSPWPSESNRGQMRGYGTVFKAAAIRWGVYTAWQGKKLIVEARGNNVRGFKRTPAEWDEDELQVRLIDTKTVDPDEVDREVLAYVEEHPGAYTTKVEAGVPRRAEKVRESLERLEKAGRLKSGSSDPPGRQRRRVRWFPHNQAENQSSAEPGTTGDDYPAEAPQAPSRPSRPAPVGGTTGTGRLGGQPQHNGRTAHDDREAAFLAAVDQAVADGTLRWVSGEERALLEADDR